MLARGRSRPPTLAGENRMQGSKRNISLFTIEKEIIKSFLLTNTNKKKIIAEILGKLKIKPFLHVTYRNVDFTSESLIKCILFMKLKGLNQSELETYLRSHKNERKKLGLPRTPDQTTISYFYKKKLSQTDREKIDIVVSKIEKIAAEKNIHLDTIDTKIKKRKTISKKRNQSHRKKELTRNIIKLYRKRIQPFITLKIGQNCVYDTGHYMNLLLQMAKENNFAENSSETLREHIRDIGVRCPRCKKYIPSFALQFSEENPENEVICPRCSKPIRLSPNAQSMFHHLKKLSLEEIQQFFLRLLEVIWEHARRLDLFKQTRVTAAVDCTNIIFYGRRSTLGTHSTKTSDGPMTCYRYITINLVDNGRRFTLMAIPFTRLDSQNKLLTQLLSYARQRVRIGLVLLDKGFYSEKTIQIIADQFKLNYIIGCPKNSRIKKMIEETPAPYYVDNYKMKGITHNLVIDEGINRHGEEMTFCFATNLPQNNDDMKGSVKMISSLYRKRWGIETSYRIVKRTFGLRTTSRDFRIRLFYFFFSVILYDLWILIDIIVQVELHNKVGDTHLVKSKYFRKLILKIDPGG